MLAANRAIAFDFDGTLVDSAPGILRGISLALEHNGVVPVLPLERRLIGPPLPVTLAKVAGRNDPDLLAALIGDFIHFYDGGACLDSAAFPGVGETLVELRRREHGLYLVTNKRGTPSRRMLDHLGWSALFSAVYCLDEHADCPGKVQLLAKVIQAHALCATETPYVGDTDGDAVAARANAMPYIHVAWGYGDLPEPTPERICTDPGQLLFMIGSTTRRRSITS
jgi:phosphoglycolate phosphatase